MASEGALMRFVILAHHRSGTHLLATKLASHPDISCSGEPSYDYTGYLDELMAPEALLHGHIRMYKHPDVETILGGHRILHLVRDPRQTALSVLVTKGIEAYSGGGYAPHYTKDYELVRFPVPSGAVESRMKQVQAQQVMWRQRLKGFGHLEVSYDEIVSGERDDELLRYLGVDPRPLQSPLVRCPVRAEVIC